MLCFYTEGEIRMANIDFKLGEWFKQVEKQAEELKAKKSANQRPQEAPKAVTEAPTHVEPEQIRTSVPVNSAAPPVVAATSFREAVVDTSAIEAPAREADTAQPDTSPILFEPSEAPEMPDFLSFLDRSRTRDPEAVEEEEPLAYEIPRDQGTLKLSSEGTGEPRPIGQATPPAIRPEPTPRPVEQPRVQAPPEATQEAPAQPKPRPAPRPVARKEAQAATGSVQENWDRIPRHLQTLFGAGGQEVAQHSYKAFRETRGDLITRLLDPPITLEEAARILDVCPTTVRRYTNRGVLKHFRTAGNQRRFRLSDVLSFMDSSANSEAEVAEVEA